MIRQTSRMLLVSIFLVTSATFQEASECTFKLDFEAKKFKLKKTDTTTVVFRNAQSQGNNIPNLDFSAGKEYVCCRQSTSNDYQSSDCHQLIYVSNETPANNVIIDVEQSKASTMSDNSSFTSSDNEKFYYHEDGSGSFAFCKLEVSSNSVGKTISIAIKQSSAILVEIEDPASETSARVGLAYDYKDANSLDQYSKLAGQAKYYFKPEVAGEVSLESLVFSIDASNAIEVATRVKANLQGETYFIRPFQATLNTKSTRKFYPDLSGFSVGTGITSATQSLSINNLRFSESPPAQYQMKVLQDKSKLLVLETSKMSLSLIPFQESPSGFKLLHNISTDVIQFVDSNDSFVTLKTKPGTKTLSISMWYSDVAGERTVQFIPYEFSPIVGKEFTCFVSGSAKDGFTLYDENFAEKTNINQCLTDGFVFQHKGNSTALNSTDLQLELKETNVNQQYRFGLTHKNNGNYIFQDIDLAVRTLLVGANAVGPKSVKYLRKDNGWLDEISLDSSPITDRALKFHAGTDSITLNLSDDYSLSEHSLDSVVDDLIALSETKDSTRDLHVNIFIKNELRNTPPDCLRVGPNSYERRVKSLGIGKCSNLQEANKKSLGGGVIEIEFHQPVCDPILSNINATTATFLWQIENYTRSRVAIPIQLGSGSSAQAQNVTNFECKNRFGTVVSKTPITIKIVQNDSGLEIGSFDFLKEKFEKNQSGFKLSESKEGGVTSALFHRESMPAITLEFKEIKYTGRTCIAISGDDLFLMKSRNFGKLATEKECRIDPNIKSKTIGNIKNNFERLVGLDNKMKIYPEGKKLSGNPYIELNLEESTSIDQLIQGTSKYYIQKTTRGLNKEYKVFIFADEARSYVEIVTFKSMLFLHVINLGVVIFVCIAAITLLLYLKHRGDFERHIDDYRCYCRSLLNSSYQASSIADQKLAAAGRSSTESSSSQFGASELLRPHPISDAPQLLLLAQSIKQSPPQMQKFALALGAAHDRQKQALTGRTASKNFELMPYESPNLPYTLHMLRGTETNVDVNTFKRLFKMVRSQVAVVQKSFLGQFGQDTDSTTRDCVIAKLDDFPSCYFIGTDSITDKCLLRILNFIENDRSISSVLLLHMKDMDSHILAAAIESISTRSLKAADYVINPLSKAMWMTAFAQKDLEPEPSIHYCTEVFKILKGVEIEPFFELKKQMKAVQNPGNSIWRVGKLTANHKFNRYTDIVPYDHSRVVLKPTLNGSDYINASHIDITLNGRSYHFYAFQAPLEHTVDAFWTAIWQEGISCMIKLTRNKERGVNKCFEYVPFKGQASKLGDQGFSFRIAADDCGSQITITLLSIAEFPNITVQLLRMSSEPPTDVLDDDTSSANSRPRTMYHTNISFHAWADHGVPAMPELERLLYLNINPVTAMPDIDPRVHECLLRAAREQKHAVHCSAGVGRTGVLIVLLCMMYEARQGCKEFNIADCVDQMRDCRNTMVQTSDQFKCLYENAQVILLNAIGD